MSTSQGARWHAASEFSVTVGRGGIVFGRRIWGNWKLVDKVQKRSCRSRCSSKTSLAGEISYSVSSKSERRRGKRWGGATGSYAVDAPSGGLVCTKPVLVSDGLWCRDDTLLKSQLACMAWSKLPAVFHPNHWISHAPSQATPQPGPISPSRDRTTNHHPLHPRCRCPKGEVLAAAIWERIADVTHTDPSRATSSALLSDPRSTTIYANHLARFANPRVIASLSRSRYMHHGFPSSGPDPVR
ncbi:hypothetical protein CC79DRAFT_1130357 [Sarocladium strictum]